MSVKCLKDPIYGYIEIDEMIMRNVVDTATFQRLRNIVQTSYAPLYSAAVHNRFIHSLGVYHLGKIAYQAVERYFPEDAEIKPSFLKRYGELFLLACLLHDVGHAPFSHTGEEYYLDLQEKDNKRYAGIHKRLCTAVGNAQFCREVNSIEAQFEPAKPHEIMSAIVALSEFPELFKNSGERSFFARCITGYCYQDSDNKQAVLNCLIRLLNSNVIDVDKLDYLIRDAYITGFDTVKIDYVRLLGALRLWKGSKGSSWQLVFHKSALSVIQNVVFAHDAEKHWIQNHPVVLYEGYILRHAIAQVNNYFAKAENKLFSYESLTEKGNQLDEHIHISLLADDDLVYLMKNVCPDDVSREYFNRQNRRHPAWKSEAEYRHLFYNRSGEHSKLTDYIEDEIDQLSQFIINITGKDTIDENTIVACRREIDRLKTELANAAPRKKRNLENLLKDAENHLDWLNCIYDVAKNSGLKFDFLIIKADQFNSGFMKQEFSDLPIIFPDSNQTNRFDDVVNLMNAEKTGKNKFFYLFYRREKDKENVKILNVSELAKKFTDLANEKFD